MDWQTIPGWVVILQRNRRKNIIVHRFFNHDDWTCEEIVNFFKGQFPVNRFFYAFQV